MVSRGLTTSMLSLPYYLFLMVNSNSRSYSMISIWRITVVPGSIMSQGAARAA